MGVVQNLSDLNVNLVSDLIGILSGLSHVASDENFASTAVRNCSNRCGKSKQCHHLTSGLGGFFKVVGCTGSWIVEDNFLSRSSAKRVSDLIKQLVSGDRVSILERQNHGVSKGAAPGQNGDLGHRIRVVQGGCNQRVTGLVVRGV